MTSRRAAPRRTARMRAAGIVHHRQGWQALTPLPVLGKVQGVEHEDTVGALVRLGLTRYEARAFIALMGRGSFTAAEVARRANLPRQRIYDVLGSLVEKGLTAIRPGGVLRYSAAEPAHALGRLVVVRRRNLLELEYQAGLIVDELTPNYLDAQKRGSDAVPRGAPLDGHTGRMSEG